MLNRFKIMIKFSTVKVVNKKLNSQKFHIFIIQINKFSRIRSLEKSTVKIKVRAKAKAKLLNSPIIALNQSKIIQK